MIADHGTEQLEEILDSHRVIERMAEAGSEPVAISDDDLDGRGWLAPRPVRWGAGSAGVSSRDRGGEATHPAGADEAKGV